MRAVLAVVLAVAGMPFLRAQTADTDVPSRIIALERLAKLQAFKWKDVKTLDRLIDNDFVSVALDGRLGSKADLLINVQMADSLQYQIDQMIVRVHQDTVVVSGLYHLNCMMHGKETHQQGRFVDTWLLKDGRWTEIASLSTPTD